MKIGIPIAGFMDWGGGIDFLRILLRGLHAVKEENSLELLVLVPEAKRPGLSDSLKTGLKHVINFVSFKKRYETNYPVHDVEQIKARLLKETKLEFLVYGNSQKGLAEACKERGIDVILPSFFNLKKDFPIPWVGYIPDFQHKYFPEFFAKRELGIRDSIFSDYLQHTYSMIVNAKAVRDDVFKFYPQFQGQVYSLPFCPMYGQNGQKVEVDISKFKLPPSYFLVSNQFWKHKDHVTAFRAFAKFRAQSDEDVHLVCTGSMSDYRFPSYIDSLKDLIAELGIASHLHLLGYIQKEEQQTIMRQARALIQPTLFEGGPGGGAVYEALALGVPVVLSDIPVNAEISNSQVLFFNAGNADDLAIKMKMVLNQNHQDPSTFLERQAMETIALGRQLMQAVKQAQLHGKRN